MLTAGTDLRREVHAAVAQIAEQLSQVFEVLSQAVADQAVHVPAGGLVGQVELVGERVHADRPAQIVGHLVFGFRVGLRQQVPGTKVADVGLDDGQEDDATQEVAVADGFRQRVGGPQEKGRGGAQRQSFAKLVSSVGQEGAPPYATSEIYAYNYLSSITRSASGGKVAANDSLIRRLAARSPSPPRSRPRGLQPARRCGRPYARCPSCGPACRPCRSCPSPCRRR